MNAPSPIPPDHDTPSSIVSVIKSRLVAVEDALGALRPPKYKRLTGKKRVRAVHALRVATRRAGAMLDVLAGALDHELAAVLTKRLKRIRSAAGLVRDCDVQRSLLRQLTESLTNASPHGEPVAGTPASEPNQRHAIDVLLAEIDDEQARAVRGFTRTLKKYHPRSWRGLRRELTRDVRRRERDPDAPNMRSIVAAALGRFHDELRKAGQLDLTRIDNLHALRLVCKRTRYGVELTSAWSPRGLPEQVESTLVPLQESLGRLNDAANMLGRIERFVEKSSDAGAESDRDARVHRGARLLRDLIAGRLQHECRHAVDTWTSMNDELLGVLRSAAAPAEPVALASSPADSPAEAPADLIPARRTSSSDPLRPPEPSSGEPAAPAPSARPRGGAIRIGAIDVGTNSTRLIIAEVSDDSLRAAADDEFGAAPSYRILDDERELTRLGKGLDASGRLDPAAMSHAIAIIGRMNGIAQGYAVERLRVIATCAVREARNGALFAELLERSTGLRLEVIGAEEEAMLSFHSASRAFDLGAAPAIVVDIGGGSTEIVLSVPAAPDQSAAPAGPPESPGPDDGRRTPPAPAPESRAVVERVYKIPVGAVRLTERFGGGDKAAGPRFRSLRRDIKDAFDLRIGEPPVTPLLVIGTGGTFTTLAGMCLHAEFGPAAQGLFAGRVQGYEVKRSQLMHFLDLLRKMPVSERSAIPGLGSDRADIIVAGLSIIDRVLKQFGANRFRVHEGGIRDGVLLSMVRQMRQAQPATRSTRRDPLRSVKRFAKACGYERAHSRHVARLSTQVFDQLAQVSAPGAPLAGEPAAALFTGENRLLLEAAGILHDVGYLINYASHHKHSYHLIMHADLPGLTRRQVEIIANVARYHRLAEPRKDHRNFASLAKPDREVVRLLAAILRVCDGLDRTHTQAVHEVRVGVDEEHRRALLQVKSAADPEVDLWGAERKSRLFRKVLGLALAMEWQAVEPGTPAPALTVI